MSDGADTPPRYYSWLWAHLEAPTEVGSEAALFVAEGDRAAPIPSVAVARELLAAIGYVLRHRRHELKPEALGRLGCLLEDIARFSSWTWSRACP